MARKVLGLDLGPNSIGWALVREGDEPGLINTGVRVFPEGVDAFETSKEASRNEARRVARAIRRQTRRRVKRRRKLTDALIRTGLWPGDPKEQQCFFRQDPFVLRRCPVSSARTVRNRAGLTASQPATRVFV